MHPFLSNFCDRITGKSCRVLAFFWLLIFVIYLPAAKSGFVADTTGWFESLQRDSFWDYINRTQFGVKSMYQFTQLITWGFYQLFGRHPWPYHLLYVTMHAANAWLLYLFCSRLFTASGILNASKVALAGALLFCISPYVSEVVVWEASYHYLQALLFIFGILLLVQHFQERQLILFPMLGGLLFFCSIFSLELFYLTPFLVLSAAVFYRFALGYNKQVFRKTLFCFSLPQISLLIVHFFSFHWLYGTSVAHLGFSLMQKPMSYFLVKPPWYLFHSLVFGRFWPANFRYQIYGIFRTPVGAIFFYVGVLIFCVVLCLRLRKMAIYSKLIVLFLFWLILALVILVPLWFPEHLLVVCDRYMYLVLSFQWMIVALLVYSIKNEWLRRSIYLCLFIVSIGLAFWLSMQWKKSTDIINSLEQTESIQPGNVKILLNSPASFNGIPMIGTSENGEFRLMHNLFFVPEIKDTMLEVAAYNMSAISDGVSVKVVDDRTLKVSHNSRNAGWWLGANEACNYENEWFRLNMMMHDRNSYEVVFKKEHTAYQILFQSGNQLKEVDWNNKNEQF